MENKSSGINALLISLREDIGKENFDITDHWEGDELAIGISKKGNPGVLVYISVNINTPIFYIELELPSETNEYEQVGVFENLKYKEMLTIIKNHLGLQNA